MHPLSSRSNNSRITVTRLIVRVPDIVDPNPEREQRVVARPRGRSGFRGSAGQELVHLVRQGEHGRLVRGDERCVDGRAAVSVVPRQDEGLVVDGRVDVDPVRAADCGVSLDTYIRIKLLKKRGDDVLGREGCRVGYLLQERCRWARILFACRSLRYVFNQHQS